jgi:hypothetical protein
LGHLHGGNFAIRLPDRQHYPPAGYSQWLGLLVRAV